MAAERGKSLRFLIFLLLSLAFAGILFINFSHKFGDHELTHHLLRDFGIACLISVGVTALYETYARYRFDLEKMETLLSTVYGSGVPPDVWDDIKTTLLNRSTMRRNAVLHLRVEPHPTRSDRVRLDLDLGYELVTLRNHHEPFEIVHGLDHHIDDRALGLPKFVTASLGDENEFIDQSGSWSNSSGTFKVSDGRLAMQVAAGPAHRTLAVNVRRAEVREVPGSYYLIMTEVTSSIRIHLDECPSSLDVLLTLYPPRSAKPLSETKYLFVDYPLLPGHALEFQLIPKPLIPTLPPQPTQ